MVNFSELSVNLYQYTRRHITQDNNFIRVFQESLKQEPCIQYTLDLLEEEIIISLILTDK
jgi:hypothetical protein